MRASTPYERSLPISGPRKGIAGTLGQEDELSLLYEQKKYRFPLQNQKTATAPSALDPRSSETISSSPNIEQDPTALTIMVPNFALFPNKDIGAWDNLDVFQWLAAMPRPLLYYYPAFYQLVGSELANVTHFSQLTELGIDPLSAAQLVASLIQFQCLRQQSSALLTDALWVQSQLTSLADVHNVHIPTMITLCKPLENNN